MLCTWFERVMWEKREREREILRLEGDIWFWEREREIKREKDEFCESWRSGSQSLANNTHF